MSNRIRYSWVSIGKRNWNPFHTSPKEEEGWQSFWSKNPRLAVTPNRGRNMMLIFPSQGQEILHQMIDMRNRRDQDKEVQMQPKDSLTIRISRMTTLRPSPTSSIIWPGKAIKESRLGTPANHQDKEGSWRQKRMTRCLTSRRKSCRQTGWNQETQSRRNRRRSHLEATDTTGFQFRVKRENWTCNELSNDY